MHSAKFPRVAIDGMTRAAQEAIKAEKAAMLEEVGIYYLSEIQLAYREKARGGTGADGIKWAALDPDYLKTKNRRAPKARKEKTPSGKTRPSAISSEIGVYSGLQRASAAPGFVGDDGEGGNAFEKTGDRLVIGFARTYSEYFDEKRELIPEVLPKEWTDQAEELVVERCTKILERELS